MLFSRLSILLLFFKPEFFFKIYLFLAALSLPAVHGGLSRCGEQGAALRCREWPSHCSGFSCCWAWALVVAAWHVEFSRSGVEPVSPSLAADSYLLSHQESLVIHFKYSSVYMSIPDSLTILPTRFMQP